MSIMSQTQHSFNKDYLPGYTGFVPTRVDRFGATSGSIK
jgi:hypothetical protein